MTVTYTTVVLRCACGREWSHHCDSWHHRGQVAGQTSTYSDTNPEPFVVQAILGLPTRLKAHRTARDLSLREVARQTGLTASTLMRIEDGRDYTVDSLLAIAAFLEADR